MVMYLSLNNQLTNCSRVRPKFCTKMGTKEFKNGPTSVLTTDSNSSTSKTHHTTVLSKSNKFDKVAEE